jgi:tryptophan synthase alpha chain
VNNSLINKSFKKAKEENRPVLLTYTVAGDNTKKKSLEILKSISKYADICELGFPHNTPIADGGQIQTSAYRAIKNGIRINDVFSIANKFKKVKKDKPIILMGYYNVILQYGNDKFIDKCNKSKVDGLIVVDLPYPENKTFSSKCKKK